MEVTSKNEKLKIKGREIQRYTDEVGNSRLRFRIDGFSRNWWVLLMVPLVRVRNRKVVFLIRVRLSNEPMVLSMAMASWWLLSLLRVRLSRALSSSSLGFSISIACSHLSGGHLTSLRSPAWSHLNRGLSPWSICFNRDHSHHWNTAFH